MRAQWQNNWSIWAKNVTVSHRFGEGPWRSYSQPTLFISFWSV